MTNDNNEERVFEALLEFLRRSRGFDFTGYKRTSLQRRVKKRMRVHGIHYFGDYLDYLEVHPEEFVPLFNTVLINVTSFFRDKDAWEHLQNQILPEILEQKSLTDMVRVWSAACSSGEEAYSIAIVLAELLGEEQLHSRVKIYATDVDEEALEEARKAIYSPEKLESLSEEIRDRYFDKVGDHYLVRANLRRVVIFGRHDLLTDAPISRLDLLTCRNALMYFNAKAQGRILYRFHFALKNSGALFLGKAEMLLTQSHLFSPITLQHRIFSKVPKVNLRDRIFNSSDGNENSHSSHIEGSIRLQEATFNSIPIAQITVDTNNHVVLANSQARSMFDLKFQDLGKPLQDLEISYRPLELRSPIEEVYQTGQPVLIEDVVRSLPDGRVQHLDVQICPLLESDSFVLGVSISFTDITRYNDLRKQLQRTNQELETANEELQSSNEELETTNEELQSTNEELETTNEELQSTNEELETMNEELHSTNEELQTINDELRLRTAELHQSNAFLNSVLESVRTGVIVVDHSFCILSWNKESENFWGLRADEVEEQSLLSLDIGLPVGELRQPIRQCLAEEKEHQEIVLSATNRRGKSISCRVSFNPLKGADRSIRGVILLLEEVS